jgi:hypothetical protein
MRIIVPIGSQSEAKSRTRLSELRGMYKEDVTIDYNSGEITVNGTPNFSFAKTYIFPSKDGQQTEIDSFAPQGYDLSGTMALEYFWKRFIIETKVPQSRFSMGSDEGGGAPASWTSGGDGIIREEMRFSYFINRIRSIYQEILMKPTWIQFCIMHPEFAKDKILKGSMGLLFVEENLFTVAKEREIASKGAETVTGLMGVLQKTALPDGTIGDEPYFDPKFLVEKYMQYTDVDLKLNEKYKKERRDEIRKLQAAYLRMGLGQQQGGGEMGGGGAFGGGGGGFGGDMGGTGGFGPGAGGMGEAPGTEEAIPPVEPEAPVGGAGGAAAAGGGANLGV